MYQTLTLRGEGQEIMFGNDTKAQRDVEGTKQGMELPHYTGFSRIRGFEFKTCSVVSEACFDFRL